MSDEADLLACYRELALDDYRPPLVAFTREDQAAKGLRTLAAATSPRLAIHYTALEIASGQQMALLTAPHGGGKTRFALELALTLAGSRTGDDMFGLARFGRSVARNDQGTIEPEEWTGQLLRPTYWPLAATAASEALIAAVGDRVRETGRLLILDNAELLGAAGPAALAALADLLHPGSRLLVLGEASLCQGWALPDGFVRHALLPAAPSPPPPPPPLPAATAFIAWGEDRRRPSPTASALPALRGAAEHLGALADATISALYRADPDRWALPIAALAGSERELAALAAEIAGCGPDGAVLAADLLGDTGDKAERAAVASALLAAIESDLLPAHRRAAAGRWLARAGDPRDLEQLMPVAAGALTMGSAAHPNSRPVHRVAIAAFRMGRFPVPNRLYARFCNATERRWTSALGTLPERANAPAVDLSWRDARECCAWLTAQWRHEGRITTDEIVRLPTEPEWEWAARGCQPDEGARIVYPWPGPWSPGRANGAEAGLNDTVAVGLFPAGRSPFGVEDMTGQVWEWTDTLWGTDPAVPNLPYPAHPADDPAASAGPAVRRVLRGGCFSSEGFKACCTYRGSLEPDGTWRGNGFRVVVA